MIYCNIPYCPSSKGKDLGFAYNAFMGLLKDGDYAVFLDHDACFTTYDWYPQLEQIIKQNPTVGAFTGVTNRVYCKWQLANVDRTTNDIVYHRQMGKEIQTKSRLVVTNRTNHPWMSGMLIVIKKSCWKKIGGFRNGVLGVDNDFHMRLRKHHEKLFCIEGLYVYHYYSNHNFKFRAKRDVSHLKEI